MTNYSDIAKSNISKNMQSIYSNQYELEKAKKANLGEVRTWSDGKKYQKTNEGWKEIVENNSSNKKEIVEHKRHGKGEVISRDKEKGTITVNFEEVGEKVLVEKLANFKKEESKEKKQGANVTHKDLEKVLESFFKENPKLGKLEKIQESSTSFGNSWYYRVSDSKLMGSSSTSDDVKIRISDHSTGTGRAKSEIQMSTYNGQNMTKEEYLIKQKEYLKNIFK